MPKGKRLDQLVVERGLIGSRQAARTAIMDGAVLVNGEKLTKPGMNVGESAIVELVPSYQERKFVSRGGLKLEKALDRFGIAVEGKICLDIGASTGGFTHCLLTRRAAFVYAIDCGYGQLDWALRNDARVKVIDRVNARYLTREIYATPPATFVCMDVSFISITKILPALKSMTADALEMELVCLVKPQFEAGRQAVGKGGVIKSPAVHLQVLSAVTQACKQLGFSVLDCTHSPIKGRSGNIEFLLHLTTAAANTNTDAVDLAAVVAGSAEL